VASAVVKKLIARPQKPSSRIGRRPKRSDNAPRNGAPKKLASANAVQDDAGFYVGRAKAEL
jgi:hypothetical protein